MNNYSQIPNEIIFSDLSPALFKTWCQLYSRCRNGSSINYANGVRSLAEDLNLDYNALAKSVQRLKQARAARMEGNELVLCVPSAEEIEYAEQRTIAAEVDEKPSVKTSTTAEEAKELIKAAWNKHKPESYMLADGKLHPSAFIAIESQRARLNIERPQVGLFVEQVCRGLSADTWWAKQTMKITSVFGFGTPRDKQYENVEKLYKLGSKVERKIDLSCDADILSKYHEKGRTDLVRVVRLEAEDQFEAGKHLNEIPDAEFDSKAAYVYFRGDKIVHWSGRNTNSTRYLFA